MSVRVAVVGAGLAGLSCARELRDAGHKPVLFDKARGPGGRACTRRLAGLTYDHGLPALDATEQDIPDALRPFLEPWSPRRARPTPHGLRALMGPSLWVPSPKMSTLGRELVGDLELYLGIRVANLVRRSGRWWVLDEARASHGAFDHVVLACPAPQAAALLPPESPLHASLSEVRYLPVWVAMAIVEEGKDIGFDYIEGGGPECVRAIQETAKPRREGRERWVLHASAKWSSDHLEDEAEAVGQCMLEAFSRVVPSVRLRLRSTHRWLYAHTVPMSGRVCLVDSTQRIGVCGDAYREPGVLGAWACGHETAEAILKS